MLNLRYLLLLIVSVACREGFGPGDQDWGYVTVRPKAHMFWWLYTTTANVAAPTDRPLVIWLQGGPGASGTGEGNFDKSGPIDINLQNREYTWVKNFNVLYIDNPVGAGFSYVEHESAFAKNNAQIGEDLLVLLTGFLERRPEFQTIPIYIHGESYGGKMGTEFAVQLYKKIKEGIMKANLKGVALCYPAISLFDNYEHLAPYLSNLGIIDKNGEKLINNDVLLAKKEYDEGNYKVAGDITNKILDHVMTNYHLHFFNSIEKMSDNNSMAEEMEALYKFMDTHVRNKLDIAYKVPYGEQRNNLKNALDDLIIPKTDLVEYLLNNTNLKVFVYNGQLDWAINIQGTQQWVNRLDWYGKEQWKVAKRESFSVNNIIEGYEKSVDNFSFFWINRAGHHLPPHNPEAASYVIRKLTGY